MAKYENIRERDVMLSPSEEEIKLYEKADAESIASIDDTLLDKIYSEKNEDESDITVFDVPDPEAKTSAPVEIPLNW